MLVLRVEYLTGVCMATRHNDPTRSMPEWPPHPDRLYSALVAAAAEPEPSGGTVLSDSAKQALEWLRMREVPSIHASPAHPRTTPSVPMPSNPHEDEIWQKPKQNSPRTVKKGFDQKTWLPIHRKKVLLPIPAVIPELPAVYFIWPSAEPDGRHGETLRSICERVTCLGRSRSLVRVTVEDCAPAATYVPDPSGDVQLRVPQGDRLSYLIDKHTRDGGKPEPSPLQRYRQLDTAPPRSEGQPSIFGRFWAFQPERGDPVLPIESTLHVTRTLRRAVLKQIHEVTCKEPHGCTRWEESVPLCRDARDCYATIPGVLSGYAPDCRPIKAPHLAFVSLPFVHPVQRHADGTIKGLAVLIPWSLDGDTDVLRLLAGALERLEGDALKIPEIGMWRLREVPADAPPLQTLDRRTWSGPSRSWTTATPMVFGHFPKSRSGGEAKVVLDSLQLAGIESSSVVEIATDKHASLHGAPPSWCFRLHHDRVQAKESRPWMRHVTLRFDRPVSGPLVVGSMRYSGLGLMRPLGSDSA